jgi:hypothetical protein
MAMIKAFAVAAVAAATTVLSVSASQACGDKLVPLGGGIRFEQIHVSRHPGKIILFLNPASKLSAANDEFRLGAALEKAGHAVRSVGNRHELEVALQTSNADLVLMDWSDVLQLQAEFPSQAGLPAILPILYRPTAEELLDARQQSSCVAPAAKRRGRATVVQSVEQILERRGKGLPVDCITHSDTASQS